MLGVRRDSDQGFGCKLKQQTVDHRLVVVRNGADRCGQGEDHMVVVQRQQFGLARIEPTLGRTGLALGAVPVAARVVGDLTVLAGFTVQQVSPQRRAAALLDGRHDLELAQAQVPLLGITPSRAMGAKDVGDLQSEAAHAGSLRGL
jgi:hypothetical protein